MIVTFIFAILFVISTTLLIRTARNSIQLIDKIDDLEEQLVLAVKILEERHKRLEAKSKTEIFFDDPVVKEVVKDIADCRDAVAKIIDNFENKEEQDE